MARTRAFDTDDVVRAARDVFWSVGYDAAAMPDLERATGLGRSSLYNAFGSKRGLFDVAVQSYLEQVVRPRLAALAAAPDGAAGLRGYFGSIADAVAAGEDQHRGCLLLTSSAGRGSQDEPVRVTVDAYRREVTEAFAAALRRDQSVALEEDIATRARLLFAALAAGMTLARFNREEAVETLRSAASWASCPAVRS